MNLEEICPSLYENRDLKNKKERLEVEKELDELGYGFIHRTNSKYYFQPDQRDAFETDIMETFKSSRKVRNFFDQLEGSISDEERTAREFQIKQHRENTAKYFGLKN